MTYLLIAFATMILGLFAVATVIGIRYNKNMVRYEAMWRELSPLQDDVKDGWYIGLLKPVTQREFFLNPRQMLKSLRSGDTTGIVNLIPISLDEHSRAAHAMNDVQAGQTASLLSVRNSLAGMYRQLLILTGAFVLFLMLGAGVIFSLYPAGPPM
jgi:hypothetical protein